MRESDRTAFLDAIIGAVATKVWRDLSDGARAALPVVGSHTALFGGDQPMPLERICEHCGLSPHTARAALGELQHHGLVDVVYLPDSDEPAFRMACPAPVAPEQTDASHLVRALIEQGGVNVHGNLTIHVEEPTVELMKLTAALADLLATQASAQERAAARIAEKVEIVRYRDPVPDKSPRRLTDPPPEAGA